ncbi:hypothetical protein NQZ68_020075 [Dissostichus eleginoides]|nr:hypothetical protein NQZ68_020075 [Dissostichus eleginoides]
MGDKGGEVSSSRLSSPLIHPGSSCCPVYLQLQKPRFTPCVGKSTVVAFSAFLNGRYPAADLSGYVTVSYSSPTEYRKGWTAANRALSQRKDIWAQFIPLLPPGVCFQALQ